MANPTTVAGKLINADVDDFSAMRVEAAYTAIVEGADAPARKAANAARDGAYSLELPPKGEWKGPLGLTVTGGAGLTLGSVKNIAANDPNLGRLEIAVAADAAPTVVRPSADPALGALARFDGRVIDTQGNPQRAGLLVVIWGVVPSAAAAVPMAVADTVTGGYFAGAWPSDVLTRAFARVSGGKAVEIPLDGNRLPRRIVLVVDAVPADAPEGTDTPPRAPTAEELATQSEAFSGDIGCCTTFTIPNRTVEEVTFQAVVRTTQPEIKGSGFRRWPQLPALLVNQIAAIARMQPQLMDVLADAPAPAPGLEVRTATVPAARRGNALADAMSSAMALMSPGTTATVARISALAPGGAAALDAGDRARLVFEARDTKAQPLQLEASVAAELARRPGEITPARLLNAERTSLVRDFRKRVDILAGLPVGRFDLAPARQADWDSVPYAYQATTIAHGHILTMKQVWRADGYSLGDLLYSLPLAPGQQKLVSILDWERREETRRTEHRITTENLTANLAHDRDISDIVRSALHERMDAQSRANTSAVGAAVGGFIGPVVFGAAGGTSTASSSANQASSRDIAASALNQARDRTLQSASAVRGQRATVVQTARQGESVRAQTEAIANNNHCHALTIEYFEVLRHFQVSQELAHVQECLFVPFTISQFTQDKALRWRHVLQDMVIYHGGDVVELRPYFEAMDRVADNWAHVDYPAARYADDLIRAIDGELWVTVSIPRPADTDDNKYDAAAWKPYQSLLGAATDADLEDIWRRYMGVTLPENRTIVWDNRLAPAIARRLFDNMSVELEGASATPVALDATLVSAFAQNAPLLVTFRSAGAVPVATRAAVARVRFQFGGVAVPAQVEAIVRSGSLRYATDHMRAFLFEDYTIQNDLTSSDFVEVATPLTRAEKNNPRQSDQRLARILLDILNERVEYFHRMIWLAMDPNRRYMFLDGVIAPDAGGRSVASVVENRVIGIVGNCLVMPVVPGMKLDPTYEFAPRTQADLKQLYAVDPPPPMRISVPTRGVFAEAVMGQCNSCEKIDDKRFWHWEQAPIPDTPTAILPLSTASRRTTPPSVTPSDFPDAVVHMQTAPAAPDPTGLTAALSLLGTKDIFRNLTGLALNQENAAAALKSVMSAAQSFATQGAALAQQKFLSGQMDRNLDLIKQARDRKQITDEQAQKMTESMFRGVLGERRPEAAPVTDNPAVKRTMDRVSSSGTGEMRITRPGGTVEVKTGSNVTTGINIDVDPPVDPVKQPSNMVCWAAAGTMMQAWKVRASMSIETMLDALGGNWRAKYDANKGLTTPELRAFTGALGLAEEGPMSYTVEGLGRLLKAKGPLWIITDDDFDANQVIHARVITGMHGDGTPDGTDLTIADPASGGFTHESFAKFAQRLEANEPVKFGVGVFHW